MLPPALKSNPVKPAANIPAFSPVLGVMQHLKVESNKL
jgi:hypothetical protein